MTDTVECPQCGTRNRVPADSVGVAHCGQCQTALPWVTSAGDDTFEQVAVNSAVPVLLDLWAPWCAPCHVVAHGVEQAAQTFAGRLKAVKVNVDEAPGVAQRYGAQSIPMVVMLRGGDPFRTQLGALPSPKLVGWVGEALEGP